MLLNPMRRLVAVVATGTVLASSVAAAANEPNEAAVGAGAPRSPLRLPPALETSAEEPTVSSLQELLRAGGLVAGDAVHVTRTVGRRPVRGNVEDLSPSALTLTDGQITWTLPEERILRIERRDPVANGVWTGLALALLPICAYSRSSEQASYQMLHYGGPLLAGAALVGGLVDSNMRETLYRASGTRRTRLSPTLLNGGLGGSLSLEW